MFKTNTPKNRIRKLRTLSLGKKSYEFHYSNANSEKILIDLCSNDYYGLTRNLEVIKAAQQIMLKEGLGSGSSRFISGTRPVHELLEYDLAKWLHRDKVLLFPSGFQANIAAIQALANRHSVIIADKFIHNSLLVGAKASGAKLVRFLHNNLEDLENKILENHAKNKPILVVVESLYSMEGTIAPIEEITKICKKYNCKLLVDEAHSIGILGSEGRGLSVPFSKEISIISGTFGKAFGSGGAFLACNSEYGEYLLQTCDPFRYTTALSPSLAAGALKALEIIKVNQSWRKNLLNISSKWKIAINNIDNFSVKGDSHILSLIIGDEDKTMLMQKYLEEKGFLAIGIRPPTVPIGQSRIRLTLSNSLNDKILDDFISTLKAYK